jgi:xanthine dehydrogenase accessory factor
VYEIASSVQANLRSGTRVDVAWAVETHGFSSRDPSEALAIAPGGARAGNVMRGALDDALADVVATGRSGRLVELHVGDLDAMEAGLSCGGEARCLVLPATDLPEQLWLRLIDREPVCLVTRLDGAQVVETRMFDADTVSEAGDDAVQLFRRGHSDTIVTADRAVTVLWPLPRLLVVGAGAIANAIDAAARLLGWHVDILTEPAATAAAIGDLAAVDKLIVLSHDHDLAGPALAAALAGRVGYIGALGSRKTQQSRAQWLAERGITDLSRIHGPAGLDIGADTPAEIAVSILAEALAITAGAPAVPLRDQTGSIHG